jgi:sorting nexin-25
MNLSMQTVVVVGVLAVVWPISIRIISSPVILLLISPFLLLFFAIALLASTFWLSYLLDGKQPPSWNSLSNAARPFAFSTPAAWQAVLTRSEWSHKAPQSSPAPYPESPPVSAALNDIIVLVVRDFVLTWYKDLSTSPSFPTAVSSIMRDSVQRVLARSSAIDISAFVVKRILPKVTVHIEQFRQSEVALRGARLERQLTHSEELDLLLASRYASRGAGKLHPAVDNLSTTFTKQSEEIHLRQLVDKALPFVLPETEARSKALKIVIREIVVCSVLSPIMEMMTDPDFWNRAIDQVVSGIHSELSLSYVILLLPCFHYRLGQQYINSM